MSDKIKERNIRLLKAEKGNSVNLTSKKKLHNPFLWAHGYPSPYNESMLCIGYQSVYFYLNNQENLYCQRFFYPDKKELKIHQKKDYPILTLEGNRPINKFDAISFTLHYEPLFTNLIEMLALSGIPLFARQRTKAHPLLIGGGVCPTYNPEQLAEIFDVLVIGEINQKWMDDFALIIQEKNRLTKQNLLKKLSTLPGVYVPHIHSSKRKIVIKNTCNNIDDQPESFIVSPNTQNKNAFFIEIMRGCDNGCKFCMIGNLFQKRIRSYESIIRTAKKMRQYTDTLRLITASENEHPDILRIYRALEKMRYKFLTSSQRADKMTPAIFKFMKRNKLKRLTIAPEAASAVLRQKINKTISDKDIFKSVKSAIKYQIPELQLFLILGFPEETDKDREAIAVLASKISEMLKKNKSKTKLKLTINCHIKKPLTAYERKRQISPEEYFTYVNIIKQKLKHLANIEIEIMDKYCLLLEGILVRGSRDAGKILVDAWKKGNKIKDWLGALKKYNLSLELCNRDRKNEELPWSFIKKSPNRVCRKIKEQ